MCYGKDMTVSRETMLQALRATTLQGQPLEEPCFAVYMDPDNGMVVRLPAGSGRDFFRQVFLLLGEKTATNLVTRRRSVSVGNGACMYFPGVALDEAASAGTPTAPSGGTR